MEKKEITNANHISITIVAGLVVSILILSPTMAAAMHVSPQFVIDNPSCSDLNSSWIELKVDPPTSGNYNDGTLFVMVTFTEMSGQPITADWSSNIGVDAVIVKGGPNANLYQYDPPAEETSDDGLQTPTSDGMPAISHISFCYDDDMIGGTGIHLDQSALLVSGMKTTGSWMIPVLMAAAGFGILISRRF